MEYITVEEYAISDAEAKVMGICPICGNDLHFEGRCGTCYNCFYSTCGM